jgi:ACR3 family arsenite efflux pump ArsB
MRITGAALIVAFLISLIGMVLTIAWTPVPAPANRRARKDRKRWYFVISIGTVVTPLVTMTLSVAFLRTPYAGVDSSLMYDIDLVVIVVVIASAIITGWGVLSVDKAWRVMRQARQAQQAA